MTWLWVVLVFVLAIAAAVVAFVVISDDQSNTPNPDTSTPATARHFDDGPGGVGRLVGPSAPTGADGGAQFA